MARSQLRWFSGMEWDYFNTFPYKMQIFVTVMDDYSYFSMFKFTKFKLETADAAQAMVV